MASIIPAPVSIEVFDGSRAVAEPQTRTDASLPP